jgi:hypothetical protein
MIVILFGPFGNVILSQKPWQLQLAWKRIPTWKSWSKCLTTLSRGFLSDSLNSQPNHTMSKYYATITINVIVNVDDPDEARDILNSLTEAASEAIDTNCDVCTLDAGYKVTDVK